MDELLITFLGLGGAQLFAAVAQAWIMIWFARSLKFENLQTFGLSLAMLALGILSMLLSFYGYTQRSEFASKSLFSWLTQFGYVSHFALLTVACLEALTEKRLPKKSVLVLSALLATLLVLPFSGTPVAVTERLLLRVGAHFVIGAGTLAGLALLVHYFKKPGFGSLRNGFAMGACAQFCCVAIFGYRVYFDTRFGGALVPLLDLFSTAVICAGLMVWLLEETRQQSVRAHADVERFRDYDGATGLANANLLKTLTREAIQRKSGNALVVIDLDHFRNIGDSLEQDQVNEVFREVASRIKSVMPADAHLARLKHDTFAALVNTAVADELERIAHQLQQALAPEMLIGARQLFLTASIGIALEPTDAQDAQNLLKAAQLALNQCKTLGRGQNRFYAPELNEQADRRVAIIAELRRAVNEDQFVLHYQPIVDLQGKIVCFEALIRWQHPTRGLLQPAEFIENLQAAGINFAVDRLVLRKALEDIKRWRLQQHQDYSVAVNVSAASFKDYGFVNYLSKLMNDMAISATAIELEITESTALENLDQALAILSQLRGMGVRVSLDDFGTGFSSLSHLRVLPISRIKIDRSFVRDVPSDRKDSAIVAAVIELAHSLELTVVAEGVETVEQRAFLDAHGVDLLQGFLLYRPKPASEIGDLLARGGKRLSLVSVSEAPDSRESAR